MTTEQYRTRSGLSIFLSFFRPHRGLFFLDLACALVVALIDLAYPIVSRYAMRTLLPQNAYRAFFTVMLVVVAAYALRALLYFVITYWGHTFGIRVEADIRATLFGHMQELGFEFFDRNRTGQLMSRMTTDLFEITELAHHGPETVIQASLTIAGAIVILATIRWELALILFLLLPVLLAVVMRLRLRLRARSLDVKRETAEINTAVEAGVSGIRTVKAFANEQDAMDKFRTSNEKFKKVKKSYYRIFGVFNAVFLPAFYKTAVRVGRSFLLAIIPTAVLMALVEALSHFPVVGPYLDATDAAGQVRQLPVLAAGAAAFALLSWLAYRKAAKNYERVDL